MIVARRLVGRRRRTEQTKEHKLNQFDLTTGYLRQIAITPITLRQMTPASDVFARVVYLHQRTIFRCGLSGLRWGVSLIRQC